MQTYFGENDVTKRVIIQKKLAFAFPAKMPILPGHILVCPTRAVKKFSELTSDEVIAIFDLVEEIKLSLKKAFGAEGFNIAWNEEKIAGQTVDHLHIHIVPRTQNDKSIAEYEPRKFLYRPGERAASTDEELISVSKLVAKHLS